MTPPTDYRDNLNKLFESIHKSVSINVEIMTADLKTDPNKLLAYQYLCDWFEDFGFQSMEEFVETLPEPEPPKEPTNIIPIGVEFKHPTQNA